MAGFYSARGRIIPPLPWPTFAPPISDFQRTGQVWAFNGIANLAENPMFSSKAGETIIVEIINNTRWPHAMHVHGHHFRVISRSASEIDDGKPWRDTALIGPEQTIEIAFVADNKGKWLFHCHMLEHAAAGMTTWFDVSYDESTSIGSKWRFRKGEQIPRSDAFACHVAWRTVGGA